MGPNSTSWFKGNILLLRCLSSPPTKGQSLIGGRPERKSRNTLSDQRDFVLFATLVSDGGRCFLSIPWGSDPSVTRESRARPPDVWLRTSKVNTGYDQNELKDALKGSFSKNLARIRSFVYASNLIHRAHRYVHRITLVPVVSRSNWIKHTTLCSP